eukprot:TRINITY_DN2297_c0_g2_i1.p1 TRINITY_DN2297_c0_g2~~TRINITY_DN2297_c0_g2_i1.p1  ORF type:complete len:255 (-),score=45.65 TRINITY_DN2297_c0_g2_i1:142-906(-)
MDRVEGRKKKSKLSPLKLCLKYDPPSLSLYYTVVSRPKKRFIHTVSINQEIAAKLSPSTIYERLLKSEPDFYIWNERKISRGQMIKLIESLVSKVAKQEDIASTGKPKNGSLFITGDRDALESSAESATLNHSPIVDSKSLGIASDLEEQKKVENYSDYPDIAALQRISNENDGRLDVEHPLSSQMVGLPRGRPRTPEGFERVFVEDLERELFMDLAGDLYDENGVLVGQAESERLGGSEAETCFDEDFQEARD